MEASLGGAARSNSASAPLSAAASESRRTAMLSIPRARISPITAQTARQRSASSIAHSRSRRCVAETVTSRSGARPKASRPAPCGAPLSASAMSSAIQNKRGEGAESAASPKANPAAAGRWASPAAATSCSAPRRSPPPSTVSMAGISKGRVPEPSLIAGVLCRARRRWRSCSIINKPLKTRVHSVQANGPRAFPCS